MTITESREKEPVGLLAREAANDASFRHEVSAVGTPPPVPAEPSIGADPARGWSPYEVWRTRVSRSRGAELPRCSD